jgi:murein DD-endopeptidase MepM/ murein hydrolase activator NlpD
MKILLIILSIILFVPEVYAIECSLPLCKRMQKQSAEFDKMFNEMRRYTITKTSFVPPVRQKYIKKKKYSKLLWPLQRGKISSKFGYRKNPFTGHKQHHNGIDIAAPSGTRIRAVASGVVTKSGWMSNGCGYGVHIKHSNYETVYCHASRVFVVKGEQIKRGQGIAEVGSTGNSTGPHLHFEIRSLRTSKSVNPLKYLG